VTEFTAFFAGAVLFSCTNGKEAIVVSAPRRLQFLFQYGTYRNGKSGVAVLSYVIKFIYLSQLAEKAFFNNAN
jgi:hypothetical protein